ETDARESRVRLGEAQETEQQAGLESEAVARQLEWQKNQLGQLKSELDESLSIQNKLTESQTDVENQTVLAQSNLKEMTAGLAASAADEWKEQASYWSTRAAVTEGSLTAAQSKLAERSAEITRLDVRRAELTARLQEAETSLNGLDVEKTNLRE